MCIIVAKPTNVAMPSEETLRTCFTSNDDGAGVMYVDNGQVVIKKGFMTYKSFSKFIKGLGEKMDLTENALVMHFRISTQGKVDGGNCHPYPITNKDEGLRALSVRTDIGMVHNGIIRPYQIAKKGSVLNDTQLFIKECVKTFYDYDKEFYKNENVMAVLEKMAGSKLCFLNQEQELNLVGDFINENGVFYSNTSYITYKYTGGYGYGLGSFKGNKFSQQGYAGTTRSYSEIYEEDYDYSQIHSFNATSYDVESDSYLDADEIVEYRVEKGVELNEVEFEILQSELEIIEAGYDIQTSFGIYKTTEDSDKVYGLDKFCNLYLISERNKDITLIEELVTVTKSK